MGALDPVTPVAAAREIFDGMPAGIARLEVLNDAGHFPWLDRPDHYWPLITGFVMAAAQERPYLVETDKAWDAYTWDGYQDLRSFYDLAATENRAVIFTVDQ